MANPTLSGVTVHQAIMADAANVDIDDARKMSGADLEQRVLEVKAGVDAGAGGDVALLLQKAGDLALEEDAE